MDIEAILEMYEDDYNPSSTVPGPRNMYSQGQLVQPNADGSRPGYSGLPDFITKSGSKINPYRVKVKKSKLNEPFSGMYPTLKKAKEVVKEKGFKKGTTGVQYPELLEKAQSVVKDYNEIVDSAITNNDLRDVKYLETYVKDRFKKKSEQDQVLRQIYKNKIDYRDLTEVRKKVAGNLVNEAMKVDAIVPNQFVYDRLGASRSAQLTSDIQQLVSDGLKNQTKIKVDRAISSVVDGDMIIDDSLKKTVGNIIGRSQFGNTAGSAWKEAFNQNSFYKKNKKLLDYAFTAGAKSTRTPGLSIQEILDDAKYKIDGGVTFSGKNTQFSGLKRYMFDYAKQHWHRNNFNGTPENSLIEFYDKNGKPIKWKSGLKLNIGEVQFKIPSESDVMWSYNGKPKGSVSVTGPQADASGIFNEVTDQYNVIKEISDAKVTNPITGKQTTYNDLVKQIYKQYGYTGDNVFGLDMDHFKGVANHPFKNLRAMDRRLNISLGAIDRTFKNNRNLKSKLKKELLGNLSTGTGSNYSNNLKKYFVNQASTVLEEGATETLATKSPYYQAVKNVYEQKNLPKTQKDLLEKSYQRATKLENYLLELAGTETNQCDFSNADGGRIGFSLGTNAKTKCLDIAKKTMDEKLTTGKWKSPEQAKMARNIAETAGKIGKTGIGARVLAELFGPVALASLPVFEVGIAGYDTITAGTPFKEAVNKTLLHYAAGDKTKADPEKLKRSDILKMSDGPEKEMLIGLYSNMGDLDRVMNLYNKKYNQTQNKDQYEMVDMMGYGDKGASAAQAQKQIDAIGNKIAEYNAQGKDYMTLSERVQDPYARGLLESKEGELLAKRDANSLSSRLFGTENPYYTSPNSSYSGEVLPERIEAMKARGPSYKPGNYGNVDFNPGIAKNKRTYSREEIIDFLEQNNLDYTDKGVDKVQLGMNSEYFKDVLKQPGMLGTQYSEGGIASLNVNKK